MDFGQAERILLCLRYGIGDVVMETPVLEALRRHAPGAHITALAAPPAVELLDGDPRVDEVVSVGRWGLAHRWDGGTCEARAALDRWIGARGFDLFLDVHHAVVAVGKVVWARGIRSLEADEAEESAAVAAGRDGVASIKAAVRAGWGLDVPDALLPRLCLSAEDRAAAASFLADAGADGPTPIGISPVASLPMKRWPAQRFAAVADRIADETGRKVLLVTGPREHTGDAVVAAMRHPERIVRVGGVHLRRVAALLARCAAFVCNDTGVMHLAAAVGTPVVGIFGPTPPDIYLPPAPHASGLVGRGIVCPHRNTRSLQPPGCWDSPHCLIADRSCVWKVGVEDALSAVRRALGHAAAANATLRRGPDGMGSARDPAAA